MRLEDLPGELLIWVLIVSELLVFAAGISAMTVMRLGDPAGFAEAQSALNRHAAALNTVVLVTSGWLAARAERAAQRGDRRGARRGLGLAALGAAVFLSVKGFEYAADFRAGINIDAHPFYMFYFLLTGFHAAHVIAGIAVMAIISIRARPDSVQAGVAFWHMVDLVWVMILPPIYLLG